MLAASSTAVTPPVAVLLLVIGIVVIVACIVMLMHRDAVNSFFKAAGTRMYGERVANRTYRSAGLIPVGIVGIAIGIFFVIFSVMHL